MLAEAVNLYEFETKFKRNRKKEYKMFNEAINYYKFRLKLERLKKEKQGAK